MAGVALQLTSNSDAIAAAFAQLADRAEDKRPLMEEIGAALLLSTQMRFESETGSDGNPWPQSLRAKLEGGKTLRDTGRLVQSLTFTASSDLVEVGTNVTYAEVHQFGATITAKTARGLRFRIGDQWVTKKSVTIPARPFLGIDDDDRDEIAAITAGWLDRLAEDAGDAAGGQP
jgi:phage virion morphogenesis protein